MFCPNCGAKTSVEQKFCRACGLGLEKIALSLTEQLPSRPDENLLSQKDRLERWGVAALSVFGLGLLVVLLYGIGYKLMITEGNWLGGLVFLGFLIMMVCGVLSAILFAKAKEAGDVAGKRRVEQKEAAAVATPTKELLGEGNFEPVPSVTDRTTELLYAEKKDTQGR
jgi:hypothetical protein